MHQFKYIHPPGGATALTAVIGGPAVTSLGYGFVWEPVLLNSVLVAVAIAVQLVLPLAALLRRCWSGAKKWLVTQSRRPRTT